MPAFKLPLIPRRNPERPTLMARARALKATTAKILHLPTRAPADSTGTTPATGFGSGDGGLPDRKAMEAYATWLFYERRLLCIELFPDDRDAERFVDECNAGADFHFPTRGSWRDLPQPSTRAAAVLDQVGCDWRGYPDEARLSYMDRGGRPSLPEGWPGVDAELVQADRQHEVLWARVNEKSDRDRTDEELDALMDPVGVIEETMTATRARSIVGMQAKARVFRRLTAGAARGENGDDIDKMAWSIARDVEALPAAANKTATNAEALDADLVRLCSEFHALWDRANERGISDEERDTRSEAASRVESAILATEPQSLAGLAAQARVIGTTSIDENAKLLAEHVGLLAAGGVPRAHYAAEPSAAQQLRQERQTPPSPFIEPDAELLRLNAEYETWQGVFHAACDAQEAIDLTDAANRKQWERTDIAARQALRRSREATSRASATVPKTPLGFGLRARIVAAQLGDWWDCDRELDPGEVACRTLLDQLISSAGLARIPRPDASPEEILAYTRPEKLSG